MRLLGTNLMAVGALAALASAGPSLGYESMSWEPPRWLHKPDKPRLMKPKKFKGSKAAKKAARLRRKRT